MHQTLYRKYRPLYLNEVCGQDVIVQILSNQLKNDKISHAYLFSGPRGTGKTSVAKILARTINCTEEKKPCLSCRFCTLRQEDNLDIIEIDAASNNGVEEIRELKSKINLTPSFGKYKVYIVDEVHMLTASAFNALLKTLEEPPSYALFILATTEIHKVPETILSRCQRLDFKRLTEDAISERLTYIKDKEKIKVNKEAIAAIAQIVQGGMRDAISLLEQAEAYNPEGATAEDVHEINGSLGKEDLKNLLEKIANNDKQAIINEVENYYATGKSMTKVLEEVLRYMRQLFLDMNDDQIRKTFKTEKKLLLNEIISLNNFVNEMKYDSQPKTLLQISLLNFADKIKNEFGGKEEQELEKTKEIPVMSKKEHKIAKKEPKPPKNDVKTPKNDPKEIENQEEPSENKEQDEDLITLKRIRIDNTFAKISKNFKKELCNLINEHKIAITKQETHGHLLLDGEIKAASDEHQYFIITFDSATCCELYNRNLPKIEKVLNRILDKELKTIALEKKEWEEYRQEYKNKKRKYEYKQENGEADHYLKKKKKKANIIEKNYGELIKVK